MRQFRSGDPGLAITIRNDRQQPLPAGQIGHIWLKGDVVIREYWQHSERRPSCDAQGWFCTGDLGYLDDEGWLYIKDRSKDMINRGGEKIYSLELENILYLSGSTGSCRHPDPQPGLRRRARGVYRAGWPASPDQRRDPRLAQGQNRPF